MRFDIFLGEEQQAQFLACPDEGKDYIEIEIGTDSLYSYNEPEDLDKLRIECYLGYSDLSPEDAILEAYSGKDVDQKRIEELDLLPEFGREYSFRVVEEEEEEDGFVLEAFEWKEDTKEDRVSEDASVEETIEGNFQTYYKMSDGTWKCGDYSYKYRLEISGRIPNAAVDSTFVYLSNLESITFEQAWKASGLSSSTEDYFDPEDAVLVEM